MASLILSLATNGLLWAIAPGFSAGMMGMVR